MQKKSCQYLLSYSPGGSTRREVCPVVHLDPHLGEGEVMGVSDGTILNSAGWLVSYRLSIVTVALSLTIRPHFAIECL